MDVSLIGYLACLAVIILLAIRVPIAWAIGGVAVVALFFVFALRSGTFMPDRAVMRMLSIAFSSSFSLIHSYNLSMIPLFIALGHIAYRAEITTDIYDAARMWLARMPGGLAIASVAGCGGFSAISGSSIACASTMGKICTPEMLRLNYDPRLATASVAAGGTLGALIPPSILFIVYAIFTESSIGQLFLAGVLPGLISLAGYALVVYIWVRRSPDVAPMTAATYTRDEKLRALFRSWPAIVLFLIVIGGIYGGIFTATEAAALALLFAILLGMWRGKLRIADIVPLVRETTVTTTTIFIIAACAKIFVSLIALTGISTDLVTALAETEIGPWGFIAMICLIYIVLGMFLDPIGIMVLTLPLIIPMVESFGFNLIWFGVIVVKLLEIGLITPPVGLTVFVLAAAIDATVTIGQIFARPWRFLITVVLVLALWLLVPAIPLIRPMSI